jgi:capsule polysaccharide export protein KpsE/RkpR
MALELPPLARMAKVSLAAAAALALAAYGICFLIPPTFTGRTSFVSPQPQQSQAAAALASLGALSNLAGGAMAGRTTADQYVGLMQSQTVATRMVERFKLKELYDVKYLSDARKILANRSRILAGKKDGLITVEVDDHKPELAAEMANAYVEELRALTNGLALSEAQQRRAFFDTQLKQARRDLTTAQLKLQKTGITSAALKATPQAAVEAFAKTRAEISATEVRLSMLQRRLTAQAPEVQAQQSALASLRAQLAAQERAGDDGSDQNYVTALREFKYQELMTEIYARQFESARIDEAREGTLIQVVDRATVPDRRSKPQRMLVASATFVVALILIPLGWLGVAALRSQRRQVGPSY